MEMKLNRQLADEIKLADDLANELYNAEKDAFDKIASSGWIFEPSEILQRYYQRRIEQGKPE